MYATLTQIATITVVMLVMDAVWLTATSAASRTLFASIQGRPLEIRWAAAAAVYALMIAAVWFFAVKPAADWVEAGGRGAFLGFVMYGLYDLTNYATLANYTLGFALQDMAWGTTLFAIAAATAKLY
jgi:uncharacterized membrane protein